LRINVVELGRVDQREHDGRPLSAAIGPRKQPCLAAEGNSTHATLGGVVRQADAAVVEEAREHGPALEHVVHGLGDVVAARELSALLAHPSLKVGDERRAKFLADGLAPFGALSVDRPLDVEQGIDPADHFQRQRRDHCRRLALSFATCVLGQIGHDEERASGVDPAGRFEDRARRAAGLVELAIAAVGVGLEDRAAPVGMIVAI
jgi:hypothetical protein